MDLMARNESLQVPTYLLTWLLRYGQRSPHALQTQDTTQRGGIWETDQTLAGSQTLVCWALIGFRELVVWLGGLFACDPSSNGSVALSFPLFIEQTTSRPADRQLGHRASSHPIPLLMPLGFQAGYPVA